MPSRTQSKPADFIVPLYMNGLDGRMLKMPSTKKPNREILLIYGHHAILERWWGLVENLNQYGNVTMPDLPGFGGMQSFSKIGVKPDVDAFADYLAAFIKLKYKQKTITVYAISFGFTVVTRMLQKYPELNKKVDIVIGYAGFMHYNEFHWSRKTQRTFQLASRLFATRPVAFIIRYGFLNKIVIRTLTKVLPNSKHRFIEVTPEEFEETMDFEVKLWQANDVRTHWLTSSDFFSLDNTKQHIDLPVIHIISEQDHYFNNIIVEQHMRAVFNDYKSFVAKSKAHVPHVTAGKKAMSIMIPTGLKRILNKKKV